MSTGWVEPFAQEMRHGRIESLVVARESDTSDLPLLEGMVAQTLERHRTSLRGVDRLLELGIEPVRDESVRVAVGGHARNRLGSRAVIFSVDGTVCLYSRGSAAKDETEARENGFVSILCETIEELRPINIYVATFSRLVRSFRQASPVQAAIENAGSTLHYGEGQSLNFASDSAYLQWTMMAAFAAMERDSVVNRMMLGRVGKHRQRKWVLGPSAVPMGYVLDADKRLVLDDRPGVRAAINKAIRLMGDPRVGTRELALALGDIGVQPPGRTRGSSWDYDPNWTWRGDQYVPRAYRPDPHHVASETHAPVVLDATSPDLPTSGPSRDTAPSRTALSDYSVPELVGERIAQTLDLWETGRLELTFSNPLERITRYAEYIVERDVDGPGHVRFDYQLDLPDGGWGSPQEFAAARDAKAVRAAAAPARAQTLNAQLPLLGNLGRWNEGDYRFGLLSAQSSHRPQYELRRIPLVDDTLHAHHAPVRGFVHQGRRRGDKLAVVDAPALHKALADAITDAVTSGVEVRPHTEYPPEAIAPTSQARLRHLRENHAALALQAQQARQVLSDPTMFTPGLRAQLVADAEHAHTRAEAAAAELEAAQNASAPNYPDRLASAPYPLAQALAVLGGVVKPTPREFTLAVNSVLSDLRLRPAGAVVECEVHATVPVTDGLLVVGPITFEVPQRMGARTQSARGVDTDTPEVREARYRQLAEQLLTTDVPIRDMADGRAFTGQEDRRRAIDWLTRAGLTHQSAHRALGCASLTTRSTLWHHLSGAPAPEGLDPAFVERIREAFFEPTDLENNWWRKTGERGPTLDFIRESSQTATVEDIQQFLSQRGNPPATYGWLLQPPTSALRGTSSIWPTFSVPRSREPQHCRPGCPPLCWAHRRARLHPCIHCGNVADRHIPVPEVRTGLLCSTCMREPTADSPIFPAEYATLTVEDAQARKYSINPVVARESAFEDATRPLRNQAREWATAQGLRPPGGKHLTPAHFNAYLAAVARGEVVDYTTIRQWARSQNLRVNSRGPVSDDLITAYRRHLAETAPRLVRNWARENGYPAVKRHTDPDESLVEAFARHRADTSPSR